MSDVYKRQDLASALERVVVDAVSGVQVVDYDGEYQYELSVANGNH